MRKLVARFPKRRHWLEPTYLGKIRTYQATLNAQSKLDETLADLRQAISVALQTAEPSDKQVQLLYSVYSKQLKKAASLGTKVNQTRNAMVAELERTKL